MQTTYTINVNGTLMDLSTPRVMGIVNVTPDSFFAGSRTQTEDTIARRVEQLLAEGADILDIGGYSSRPGAADVSPEEERERLRLGLEVIRRVCSDAVVSVDTFRADVARMCVEEYGVAIINDISGGELDAEMFPTVARLGVPYILMHMQGTPQTMQNKPHYDDVLQDVFLYFARKVQQLRDLGQKDIILDPGFGLLGAEGHHPRPRLRLRQDRGGQLRTAGPPGRVPFRLRPARTGRHLAQVDDHEGVGHHARRGPERHHRAQYPLPNEGCLHPPRARRPSRRGGRPAGAGDASPGPIDH